MPTRFLAPLALLLAGTGGFRPPLAGAADVSFERDVMPGLSRAGCNAGACHGNLNGKGGLKLSLKGENPAADRAALTRDMLARRTDPLRPAESLMLLKPTGQAPHEGGVRFSKNSTEYTVLRTWIANGCPADPPGGPKLAKLEVTPASKILFEPADRFRVTTTAHFTDGSIRDVTGLATFEFTAVGVAKITPAGEVIRENVGEVVLVVRYLSQVATVRIVFLPDRPVPEATPVPTNNEIDRLVFAQLKEL